jgi:hypothetical protein
MDIKHKYGFGVLGYCVYFYLIKGNCGLKKDLFFGFFGGISSHQNQETSNIIYYEIETDQPILINKRLIFTR